MVDELGLACFAALGELHPEDDALALGAQRAVVDDDQLLARFDRTPFFEKDALDLAGHLADGAGNHRVKAPELA